MNAVELRAMDSVLVLRPDLGGAIARYATGRDGRLQDWLRPLDPRRGNDVLAAACFPVLPFFGRIREGRFRFGDRLIALPPNVPPSPHPLHGHGWQQGWEVIALEAMRAVLRYQHAPGPWPWAYEARQTFTLSAGQLTVEIELRNLADADMPAGIGLHPYFPRTPLARVRARALEVWETNTEVMPLRRIDARARFAPETGIEVDRRPLNDVFGAWDGHAEITWPEWRAALTISAHVPFGNLVIYAPAGEAFFCVEPVSNVTDAFNLLARGEGGHGARVLRPGEALAGVVTFRPLPGTAP